MTLTPGERLRLKRAAPSPPADPAAPGGEGVLTDPGAHTVAEVLAHVEAHPEDRDAIRAAEQAGRARSTLLEAL